STWTLDGVSYGAPTTAQGGGGDDTFAINANLSGKFARGGGGNDTFTIGSNAGVNYGVSGTDAIDGEGGSDKLSFSSAVGLFIEAAAANGYTVDVTNGGSTFQNIDEVAGSGGASDSLTGNDTTATWSLGASPTPTYANGSNVLKFSGFTTLQGGTGTDTLTGPNATNAWTLNAGATASTVGTTSFKGMEKVVGGTGSDTFTLKAGASFIIDGGSGTTDKLDASDLSKQSVSLTGTGSSHGFAGGFGVNTSTF